MSFPSTAHEITINRQTGVGNHWPADGHWRQYRIYHDPVFARIPVTRVIQIRRAPIARRIPDRKIVGIKIRAVIGKSLRRIPAKPPWVVACTIVRSLGSPFRDVIVSLIVNINRVIGAGATHHQGQQQNLDQCFHTADKNTTHRVNQR